MRPRGRHRRGRSAASSSISVVYQRKVRPRAGLGADHRVDLLLGADVDAAHRVVHQRRSRRRSRARGRTAPSAGCRRTATGSGCPMSGVRMPMRSRQSSAKARSRRRSSSGPARKRRERADADVLGDRPEREDAVGLPVAGDQRDRRRRPRAPSARLEDLHAASRSGRGRRGRRGPTTSPAMGDELARRRRGRAAGRARTGGGSVARAAAAASAAAARRRRCPWRRPAMSRSKARGARRAPRPGRRASPRSGRRSPGSRRGGARSGCTLPPPAVKRRT